VPSLILSKDHHLLMAPKADLAASDTSILLFKSIGLSQAKAAEAAKNAKSANVLRNLIVSYDLTEAHLDEKQATVVTALAGQLAKTESVEPSEQAFAVKAILQGKLKSVDQVNGEFCYATSVFTSDRFTMCSCCQVPRDI